MNNKHVKFHPLHQQQYEMTDEYFRETSPGSIRVIANAQKSGQKRAPKRHDIFVHHNFPFSGYVAAGKEELASYEHAMKTAIQKAESPSFIGYYGFDRNGRLPAPIERTINSNPFDMSVSGCIGHAYLEELLELFEGINPKDMFRIHGAALGCCPTEFAKQLYGIVYKGQFWPDIPDNQRSPDNLAYCVDQSINAILIAYRLFEQSSIRLGVVHDSKRKLDRLLDPQFNKPITTQMIDAETNIVPYQQEEVYQRAVSTPFRVYEPDMA